MTDKAECEPPITMTLILLPDVIFLTLCPFVYCLKCLNTFANPFPLRNSSALMTNRFCILLSFLNFRSNPSDMYRCCHKGALLGVPPVAKIILVVVIVCICSTLLPYSSTVVFINCTSYFLSLRTVILSHLYSSITVPFEVSLKRSCINVEVTN